MGCGAGGAVHVVPLSCHRVTLLGCWQYQCCAGHDGKGHSEHHDTLCTSVMQHYSAWQEISRKETYSTTVQSGWRKYSVAVAWRRVIKHIWPLPHWYENGLALMYPPWRNTALITCRPFLLVPQERVRVTALQESLRQNSYPIRRQGWLKIAPREQAWERDGPK